MAAEIINTPVLGSIAGLFSSVVPFLMFFVGLSLVVFIHELGHFLVAKWCDVRISDFAIGFGPELAGFTRGETRYSLRAFPLGGYVKMLGQEDFTVDKEGELSVKDDPRSYLAKTPGQRMMIVSAGVIMNAAFALVLFVFVYMIGMEITPARVGIVLPDQPGYRAGLRPGDEILSVGNHNTRDWGDVTMQIALSSEDKPLTIVAKGPDGNVRTLEVEPEYNSVARLRRIGVSGPQNLVVADTGGPLKLNDPTQLQPQDKIVAVNGKPMNTIVEAMAAISAVGGKPYELTVERSIDEAGQNSPPQTKQVIIQRRARINLRPAENPSLLGASPRLRVNDVETDGAAGRAGMQAGDVILSWDGIVCPTWKQIEDNIREYPRADQLVEVLRDGETSPRKLIVRPESPFRLAGHAVPRVGIHYMGEIDDEHLVLARVAADSPMAKACLEPGDEITAVAGTPVADWYDLIDQLRASAGKTVPIAYKNTTGQTLTSQIGVPRSLDMELGLPSWPQGVIISIDKQRTVRATQPDGSTREYSVSIPEGARIALQQALGKTIPIEYQIGGQIKTANIDVTENLTNPWNMQVQFTEPLSTYVERATLRTSNPLTATVWGFQRTWYLVMSTYVTIKQMLFTQQIGVENLSGPVGIVRIGTQVAESGVAQLIGFLAFLSVNFAVVNFLPFPIVDGGHFMFLLIEKIKGKPLSIRVQMVTQMIGLAMILGAFIFLTLQDIVMWDRR